VTANDHTSTLYLERNSSNSVCAISNIEPNTGQNKLFLPEMFRVFKVRIRVRIPSS